MEPLTYVSTNKILLYCFAISLSIFPSTAFSVHGKSNNNSTSLFSLVDRLGRENQKISNDIIKEDYSAAQESSASLLKGLEELIEIFIPLPDRIKKLLVAEQKISNKINSVKTEKPPLHTQAKEDTLTIMEAQNLNLIATEKTVQLISQQLNSHTQDKNGDQKVDEQELKKLLIEVRGLILKAGGVEKEALNSLQKKEFLQAQPKVAMANKLFEEALNKFQKKNQQGQKNGSQNQQDKNNSQKQAKKNGQAKRQQKIKDETQSPSKQKMSPREALKELAKIQNRASKELKKREKRYGKLKLPVQIQVEKDW
jgi:hypothetical protein